jgi:ankyrin repeat protein
MATIFELIDAGDAAGLRELLARDPDAAAARDEQGLTVVMRAAYRGLTDIVLAANPPLEPFDRIVVGKSTGLPAPDAWTPDGFTPLHIAAFVDNVDAARALLDAGADPNVYATASFARVTPLGTCRFANADRVRELLLERGADPALVEES